MKRRRLGPTLRKHIRKRLERVLRDGPKAVARGRRLHELRIAVKRLRYALELTRTFAPEAVPALKLLAQFQDRLGALADAEAFGRAYAAMLAPLPLDDPRRAGLLALGEAARAERGRALSAVRSFWAGEAGGAYPEMLAASISAALGSLSPKDPS